MSAGSPQVHQLENTPAYRSIAEALSSELASSPSSEWDKPRVLDFIADRLLSPMPLPLKTYRVLFYGRQGHRREIANSEDVVRWLSLPEFYEDEDGRLPLGAQKIQVNFVLDVGTNLANQAQQFWDTDLIVISHGATTGWPCRCNSLSIYIVT